MKQLVPISVACILVSTPVSVVAADKDFAWEAGGSALFGSFDQLAVTVQDKVDGKCFLGSAAVKTATELTFRRSGITVLDEPNPSKAEFVVNVMGFRDHAVNGRELGCTVYVSAALRLLRPVGIPYADGKSTFMHIDFEFGGRLLSGSDEQSARVKQAAVEAAESLANTMYQARATYGRDFPAEYAKVKTNLGIK